MKISSLITIYYTILISFIIISYGQATLKEEGLGSKSIEETSSTISGGSSNASFTVSSADDVGLKDTNGSWSTSCSNSYGSKLIHIYHDNFTNCHPTNGSISGKTITLSKHGTLTSLGSYKVKIRKTPLDRSASNQSKSGV